MLSFLRSLLAVMVQLYKRAQGKIPFVGFSELIGLKIQALCFASIDDGEIVTFALMGTGTLENCGLSPNCDVCDAGDHDNLRSSFLSGILGDDLIVILRDKHVADNGNSFCPMAHEDATFPEHGHEGLDGFWRKNRGLIRDGVAVEGHDRNDFAEILELWSDAGYGVIFQVQLIQADQLNDAVRNRLETVI